MCIGDFAESGGGGGVWEGGGARSAKEERTAESEARLARLARTIEGEIVPRLVLARHVARLSQVPKSPELAAPDDVDVKELVRLLLAHDVAVASAYVETVRHRGASLEVVCLQLLAPAARELGLLWEQDECDFMQVTVGLCRLHHLLRELAPEFRADEIELKLDKRILLAPLPGEQHTFGITLVAQFLRRAGWDVWHEFPNTDTDILEVLHQNWFTVVGLSVGIESRLDHVTTVIEGIRRTSRNRAVGVLVGGPLFVAKPEIASLVGADATAADGMEAVERAEMICRRQAVSS
jgi:MerR family transcriptional regulator, light-induced transcriptional regulator